MKRMEIGTYHILEKIAEGGMGEIYLAEDPSCDRKVALKRIKKKLLSNDRIKHRFIREAKLASRLSHPSIIPIYSLHQDDDIYYTMPYVEGETLKEIIRASRKTSPHPIGTSIPHLMRIFLNVCQAIHSAHKHGVLHRDIKAENILVGTYGEVLLIDWGIACEMKDADEEGEPVEEIEGLTMPGKVVGTVAYMAPERAFGHKASIETEVYALGVILYQLLTLELPFKRPSLKEFKKRAKSERLKDPSEVAPHRDIPTQLVRCVERCLQFRPENRYPSVSDLIADIERYIEGSPEWSFSTTLSTDREDDWEFQENIVLAKHIAITKQTDVMEWVMLMISRASFTGNTRFSWEYTPGTSQTGFGFACMIPEPDRRTSLEDGYVIWFNEGIALYRTNVEVASVETSALSSHAIITVEILDNTLNVYLDSTLALTYSSHMPMVGGHIGFFFKDMDFTLSPLDVETGSQSIMVNCLAVPDAFMNSHDYERALEEYQKIAQSFRGRVEGREALFRSGLTLLKMGKQTTFAIERKSYFAKSAETFSKLHNTPGAPLEYLGKSLISKAENDPDEEAKTLEFGIRKCRSHPLLPMLEEHLLFRLLESSRTNRKATYSFVLIILLHLKKLCQNKDVLSIIETIRRNIEIPYFIELKGTHACNEMLSVILAYSLNRPVALYEIITTIPNEHPDRREIIGSALHALVELGASPLTEKVCLELGDEFATEKDCIGMRTISEVATYFAKDHSLKTVRHFVFLAKKCLLPGETAPLFAQFHAIKKHRFSAECLAMLKALYTFAYLLEGNSEEAGRLLEPYTSDSMKNPASFFFSLYGCYLLLTEGEDIATAYFHGADDEKTPPSSTLLAHAALGTINPQKADDPWQKEAFRFEKLELYRYLILYYTIQKKKRKATTFQKLLLELTQENELDFL